MLVLPSLIEDEMRELAAQIYWWKWHAYNTPSPLVTDAVYDLYVNNLVWLENAYPDLVSYESPTETIGTPDFETVSQLRMSIYEGFDIDMVDAIANSGLPSPDMQADLDQMRQEEKARVRAATDWMFTDRNGPIEDRINRARHNVLIHSIIYYQLDDNLIDDGTYDRWGKDLAALQRAFPVESENVPFMLEVFRDFGTDGTTSGFNLPLTDPKANVTARRLLAARDRNA